MFPSSDIKDILLIQQKLSSYKESWTDVPPHEIKKICDWFVLEIENLQRKEYDIRILASNKYEDAKEKYLLFETVTEKVAGMILYTVFALFLK